MTYLEGLPLIDISENTDVTLDGYRGKYLEYTKRAEEWRLRPGRVIGRLADELAA